MDLFTYCPNCDAPISNKRVHGQDWFFCKACQSIFFSHESLRENWPSLYKALADKKKEQKAAS